MGTNGRPVESRLCGLGVDPNDPTSNPLPRGSLTGAVARIARRLHVPLEGAARQAAGAVGMILVDNRFGEANAIPIELPIPAGMIADLDGERLRGYMSQTGGRTIVRADRAPTEIVTGRSGVITSFSSAAPTNFGHALKPDVAAPGGQILSSTSPESAGGGSVRGLRRDEHAGAARRRAPPRCCSSRTRRWTPRQMRPRSSPRQRPPGATPRARGGARRAAGRRPRRRRARRRPLLLFTAPVSLSFGDLDVNRGPQTRALAVQLDDAGGGAGTWSVDLRPQAASAGATIEPDPQATIAPGGGDRLAVTVRASADAAAGDNFGFIVLRRGDVTRRVPYYFAVTRPGLELRLLAAAARVQHGRHARRRLARERLPLPRRGRSARRRTTARPGDGAGRRRGPLLDPPRRAGRQLRRVGLGLERERRDRSVDPRLGRRERRRARARRRSTSTTSRSATRRTSAPRRTFVRPKRYWVSVDSGRSVFTGQAQHGAYVLKSWVNDVYPPLIQLVTTRVTAGRPLIVARVIDAPRRAPTPASTRRRSRSAIGARSSPPPRTTCSAASRSSGSRPPRRRSRPAARRSRCSRRLPGGEERVDARRQHPPEHERALVQARAASPGRR